ncbi:hypothetical protein KIN20_010924 [Parelaphostrongylus tenuis]|uniref:Uncharacterized protein n=1 Tax=Parelaphostrongylus tenuis TaxID=148309 RepID=A0AAD5MU76_PARTN|nr:hypothetical protein KIN20_010924 [Parelaphostrongylus tenuis]
MADEHVDHVADGRDHVSSNRHYGSGSAIHRSKTALPPDVAGGAYTKEAEEADRKQNREADDHLEDREAARGQEDSIAPQP